MMSRRYHFLTLVVSLFLFPIIVSATTIGISANSDVKVGDTFTAYMYIDDCDNVKGGIVNAEANLTFDKNYFEYISGIGTNISPTYTFQINPNYNYKIAGLDTSLNTGITSKKNIFTFKFKALKTGSSTISLKNVIAGSIDGGQEVSVKNKEITISERVTLSSNTNLSSLSVSNGNISFDKNTTTYNITVDKSTTSVNISARPEDKNSKVEGLGTKKLNYGTNTSKVTVTAPNSEKKVYTINIVRNNTKSSNNNLSNIIIENVPIFFDKDTLEYSIDVPYNMNKLNIKTTKEDELSKVEIKNKELTPGKTTDIKIIVTAENGSKKTYTIHAKRANVKTTTLSSNNYLKDIIPSIGTLSPKFNKDISEYTIYLTEENLDLKIDTVLDDDKSSIKEEKPSTLNIGNNYFNYIITAENKTSRIYKVNAVVVSTKKEETPPTVNLKNLIIKNGELNETFDENKKVYTYNSDEDIEVFAEPLDDTSKVTINKNEGLIAIVVKSQDGEVGTYLLKKESPKISKSNNTSMYIIPGIALLLVIVLLIIIKKKHKRIQDQ